MPLKIHQIIEEWIKILLRYSVSYAQLLIHWTTDFSNIKKKKKLALRFAFRLRMHLKKNKKLYYPYIVNYKNLRKGFNSHINLRKIITMCRPQRYVCMASTGSSKTLPS